jgi:hypothetical protein
VTGLLSVFWFHHRAHSLRLRRPQQVGDGTLCVHFACYNNHWLRLRFYQKDCLLLCGFFFLTCNNYFYDSLANMDHGSQNRSTHYQGRKNFNDLRMISLRNSGRSVVVWPLHQVGGNNPGLVEQVIPSLIWQGAWP